MRQQHTQRTSTAAPGYRAKSGLPTSGYALVVDGQIKSEFNTHDGALKVARELKERFPMLQVKVYDAEKKHSEKIEIDTPEPARMGADALASGTIV